MIHPLTLVTFAAFLGAGLYVFQTKEEVAKLDVELRGVTREIEAERQRTQTLSAEWARLNDQDRLRSMVASHLREMQPMEPAQFQRMDDAQRRMPQVVAFVPDATGFRRRADAPSAPGEVLLFTAATMLAEAEPRRAAPQRVVPAPAVIAAAPPAPPPAPAMAAAAPPATPPAPGAAPRPAPQPVAVASVAPAPRVPVAPRPEVAALPPIAGPSAAAAPAAAPAAPVESAAVAPRAGALPPIAGHAAAPAARLADAAPAPRPAPRARAEAPAPRPSQLAQAPVSAAPSPLRTAMHVQPAPVMGGSLLGGGMSLPPPVPFGR